MALMLDSYEVILSTLESQKSVPAPFLTKTYQLVDDPATNHIVSWNEDDTTTFVVWRPSEFARDILPNYFKHNNFSSFVRQLNTYGFRKIVPDRWEFANYFFKKDEKQLLCEIRRRKPAQPQVALNHHHHHHHHHHRHHLSLSISSPSFSQYTSRVSSDEQQPSNLCGSPPLYSPNGISAVTNGTTISNDNSVTALSEDNQKLRKRNDMLMSELAHMRKLYNDIIYFIQNHVKPVAHSNSYPSSPFFCNSSEKPSAAIPLAASTNSKLNLKAIFQPEHSINQRLALPLNSKLISLERPATKSEMCNTKLFGVQLPSKKRLHSEFSSSMETNKARLILEKDDLRLKLMPSFPC